MLKLICIIFVLSKLTVAVKKIECGYKQCPQTRDGALNVHIIPHSHMDAGWVKTFDEYYYGTKTSVSTANVQLIYHSVLSELLHDKKRKFTFSETGYFWRWWKEQRPTTRATFRTLVQEGRVEFAGGGWVNNDEATLDYLQIIDQFTWGLRKLNDTLGPCGKPKAAWQIDTYGHTREQASLLAQMGYDGLFVGRVDHKVREAMIEEDRMEFMWRGSDVLGKMSDIMTHNLFNLYNAPEGFCFDFLCNDEPIVDDPDNHAYNAEKRVSDFIAQIERQAKYYDHDNIIVTMGGDFTYQSAANWFINMDKLINHVTTHPANISDINIFYSTPSCYLKAVYLYGRRDKAVYTEKGDLLPYGSDSVTYWTGYYTSRPSFKYLVRRAHVFLQVVKQLTVIARLGDSYELHLLRHAMGLVLHHDAITGTSQQHVTNDFIRILSEAIDACTKKVSTLLSTLTPTWGGTRRSKNSQQFTICHQLNISQCRFTETQETMLLLVYNPLSVKTYHHVRLPAIALHYSIRDFNDEEVEYQLVPLPAAVTSLPGRSSTAIQELCFEAENIPPLGYTAYYISPVRDQLEENAYAKKSQTPPEPEQELVPVISNEYLKVAVNKETGLLESIQHVDGVKIQVFQNFYFYSQSQQTLQSGAYSFRPEKDRPTPVTEKATYHVVRGTLVKEIRQKFSDWVTQIIRLYRGEEFLELEWIIGPIPVGNDLGKEVVSVFSTNITNSGEFFTDSNGRQMMRRTCWNETASHQQKKSTPSCYYPVTSRICIHSLNSSVEMCVLTDRSQGGTSYNEGEIELMVHRRLLTDDGFGLEESLNEEAYGGGLVIKGKHRIVFGNFRQEIEDLTFSERASQAARRWLMEPWLFLTPGEKITRRKWQHVRNKRYSALKLHGLPRHIHVLTLEPWKAGTVLLRLENTLEQTTRGPIRSTRSEGPEDYTGKSSYITVELRKLFLQLQIRMVRETTLAANQWLDDARQMDWSTRYVYAGSEDGILPEDNMDYPDEKPQDSERKDNGAYSDEDPEYTKKTSRHRNKEKSRSKVRSDNYDYERRKRAVNISENIIENIINATIDKTKSDIEIINKSVNVKKDEPVKEIVTQKPVKAKEVKPDMSMKKVSQAKRFDPDWKDSEEGINSDEEDFSSNLRKRSPRRRSRARHRDRQTAYPPEITGDDADDGITKSIYEMYYKTKPKTVPFKPFIRSSEEYTEPHRRKNESKAKTRKRFKNYDYEDVTSTEYTTTRRARNKKRGKSLKVDMPFFITDGGRKYKMKRRSNAEGSEEKEFDNEEYGSQKESEIPTLQNRRHKHRQRDTEDYEAMPPEFNDDDRDEREDGRKRRKRATAKEEIEQTSTEPEAEAEYIVTLRPTQIRTFIIWFENKKTFP